LFDLLPLLKNEIIGEGNFGADYVRLSFKNGSFLDIMSPINSTRGNRATAGIIDEFRQKIFIYNTKIVEFSLLKFTFIMR